MMNMFRKRLRNKIAHEELIHHIEYEQTNETKLFIGHCGLHSNSIPQPAFDAVIPRLHDDYNMQKSLEPNLVNDEC